MRILLATSNPPLGVLIRRSLTRHHPDWVLVDNGFDAFQKIVSRRFDVIVLEYHLPRMEAVEILRRLKSQGGFKSPPIFVLTFSEREREQIEALQFPQTEVIARPISIREFVVKILQALERNIRVACLGGGTGLFTLLSGLKTLPGIGISSIVSMSDDGGSSGTLRDRFGVLPPGDVRRSLVALSTAPDLLNELMQYRFERGGELKGHNLGNLLLTALSEMRGSMIHAVESISEILNIQGRVIPVTEAVNTLKAELENGTILEGEHRIDLFEGNDPAMHIRRLWQEPPVKANPDALRALMAARFILLGPGDLFTSVIPNLIVEGIPSAIISSRAKKIYVCNIMTKPGETTNFQVSDHVREVVKYLGKDCLDYILASSTSFSRPALKMYASKQQFPVIEKSPKNLMKMTRAKVVWADMASETELVRHDSLKLATAIRRIIEKEIKM